MVDLDLPELALHQAQTLTTLEPNNGRCSHKPLRLSCCLTRSEFFHGGLTSLGVMQLFEPFRNRRIFNGAPGSSRIVAFTIQRAATSRGYVCTDHGRKDPTSDGNTRSGSVELAKC